MGVAAPYRVARKYRLLGYEVEENPEAELLPEFMQGVRPGILAQSKFDNVVVGEPVDNVSDRLHLPGSPALLRQAGYAVPPTITRRSTA